MSDIIIGSGPAGVAAAKARLALGRAVILLDGGKVLEPDKAALRDAVAAGDDARRADYIAGQKGAENGQVRRFGSDFAMEPREETFAQAGKDGAKVWLRASRAVGGLSNLWGTAVLPFASSDMAGWPVDPEDLAPHFREILKFVPVAGRVDALAEMFPDGLPEKPQSVAPTAQAAAILSRFEAAREKLAGMGVTAGQARQAVGSGCRHCGLCLNGCPWGQMWSAAHELPELLASAQIDHRPGAAVTAISQGDDSVTCHLENGASVTGERVFLAAGVLESARILMASGVTDHLSLREARHAFLPSLSMRANPMRPDQEPLTTLPQMFMELSDPAVSPYLVHAQLYGWNEQYAPDLAASYGSKLPGFGWLWPVLARRLVVAQLFLHSDHWPVIDLRLAADGRLEASVGQDADAASVLAKAAKAMGRGMRAGGLLPLTPALRPAGAGASFHVGASLPMSETPGPAQSDPLGRPGGAGRLHVVDASVLPAVPATTITLPVMANAHRIAFDAR